MSTLLDVLQVLFFKVWIYILIGGVAVIVLIGTAGILWYVYYSDSRNRQTRRSKKHRSQNFSTVLRGVTRGLQDEIMPPYPAVAGAAPRVVTEQVLPAPAPQLLEPDLIQLNSHGQTAFTAATLDIEDGIVIQDAVISHAQRTTTLDRLKKKAPRAASHVTPHSNVTSHAHVTSAAQPSPRKAPRTKRFEQEIDHFQSCDSFVFNESPTNSGPSSASSTHNVTTRPSYHGNTSVTMATRDVAAKPRDITMATESSSESQNRHSVDDNRFSTRLSGELSPKVYNDNATRDVPITPRDVPITPRDVTITPRDVTITPRDVTMTTRHNPEHTYINIGTRGQHRHKDTHSGHTGVTMTTRDVAMTTRDVTMTTSDVTMTPEESEEDNLYVDGFSLRAAPGSAGVAMVTPSVTMPTPDMIYQNQEVNHRGVTQWRLEQDRTATPPYLHSEEQQYSHSDHTTPSHSDQEFMEQDIYENQG